MTLDEITPAVWRATVPFPHAVIDGLWDEDVLDAVVAEFPAAGDRRWVTYPDPKEYGKRAGGSECWGEYTELMMHALRSEAMCEALETVTGVGPLTSDVIGGGMHMTTQGGRLAPHVDFNIHPTDPTLERRLNLLVFLNREWRESNGGTLFLGDNKQVKVLPEHNRTVIFETGPDSWHGHPDPIIGDHERKSLAVYYYAPRRDHICEAHSTVWLES